MIMSKRMLLRTGIGALFFISIICAIGFKFEPIKFAFSALAFGLIGWYNTIDYKFYGKKSSLAFAIMFYCFGASALAFAVISILLA